MKLSIVIPAYNEKNTIQSVIDKVAKVPYEKEIIIVDDCSADGTADILKGLNRDDTRVFFHEVNRGKGAALRTGFSEVTGEIVIIQDADLEYTPDDYPLLCRSEGHRPPNPPRSLHASDQKPWIKHEYDYMLSFPCFLFKNNLTQFRRCVCCYPVIHIQEKNRNENKCCY